LKVESAIEIQDSRADPASGAGLTETGGLGTFAAIVSDDRETKMRAIRSNLNAQTRPCTPAAR
jgi:hypothetical protein